jgi:hypothetical protein
LLSAPSYAFPFFGQAPDGRSDGPNERFATFVEEFDKADGGAHGTQFLVNQGTVDKGKLGLINIDTQTAGAD